MFVLLIALMAAPVQSPAEPYAPCPSCNVVLVTVDTLRADRVFLGDDIYTPRIEHALRHSTYFSQARSLSPCTEPAVRQIHTGRRQPNNGSKRLAESFAEAGYATAAFVSQHQFTRRGKVLERYSRGFQVWSNQMRTQRDRYGMSKHPAQPLSDEAIAWVRQATGPFFLWVHYFDPHDPYSPPGGKPHTLRDRRRPMIAAVEKLPKEQKKPWYGMGGIFDAKQTHTIAGFYDEELSYMDKHVGRLLEAVTDGEQSENTVVIFSSDHGERLGDDGEYWDHCHSLHDWETRVPLAISLPGWSWPRRIDRPVAITDIALSIHSMVGLKPARSFQGRELRQDFPGRIIVSTWRGNTTAYDGRYKLYWRKGRPNGLYDLSVDPREEFKLTDYSIIPRLIQAVRTKRDMIQLDNKQSERVIEELRAMGYTE